MGGFTVLGDFDGRPTGDYSAALFSTFRTQIDQVIGIFDDIEVVLDRDDSVAHIDKPMQDFNQLVDVGEV